MIDRKNWLFANIQSREKASAIIFRIVESAKENRLTPYAYFYYLIEKLPNLDSRNEEILDQLLPWNVKLL